MQIPFLSLNSLGIHHHFAKKENSCPNSRKGHYFLSSRNYLLATLGLASMMGGIFATTATAEVTTFGVSVRSDGTANFSGPDPTYPGFSNAGNDANDENGIVRTYDTVTYRVNYATDTQPNGSTTITVTIGDDYHLWEENQSSCLGSVSVSSDRKTLTCTEPLPTSTTGFFDFTAAVLGTAPHGADLEVNANLTSSAGNLSAGPTQVKVSATPQMDLAKDDSGAPRRVGTLTEGPGGEEGVLYVWPLSIIAPKGSEVLGDDDPSTPGNQMIITDVVSGISPNARLYTWGGRSGCAPNTKDNSIAGSWIRELPLGSLSIAGAGQETNAVTDSGTWSCSQSGAGNDITITITDADLSGQHRPTLNANGGTLNVHDTHLVAGVVEIWIPTSDFPAGGNQLTVTNYYDFLDTPSVTNQSNIEPDQGGNVTVPISNSDDVNNDRTFALQQPQSGRSQDKYYRTPYSGGNFNNNSVLYPMTDIESGDGVVLPGESVGSYFTIRNTGVGDLTNVMLCDKFDNRTQILAPNPTSGQYVEFRTGGQRLTESDVIIEYGVGGDTATDSYYGGETAAIGDVTRFEAQRNATCNDGDATWYSEANLASNPGLIPQVTRVRIRPSGVDGVLPEGFRIDAVLHLQVLNIDPVTGIQIPDPTILANFVTSRVDELKSGNWDVGSYNPVDHSGNDDGDRLQLTRAIVRIDKSTDDPTNGTEADDSVNTVKATENITFALETTLTALTSDVSEAEIVVTDTLPTELSYVTGSANITPDSVIANGDGTTTLSWSLGDYSPNVPIPTITFEAKAGFDIVGGTSIANQASVAALDDTGSDLDSSPLESRTDIRSVTIVNNAAFTIFKEAVTPEIEPGEDIVYDLYLANLSEDIDVTAGSEFIDILPYEGDGSIRDAFDGVGTPPTDYTATPIFKTIQDVDNAGFTFQFTNDSPNNISDNPATQNGSTVWCTPADITSGAGGCPAADYSDVTAVLITAPAMNAGDPTRRLRLTMSSTGSLGGDIYTNNFKGTPDHPSLGFIPSVDATVRTRASTFSGPTFACDTSAYSIINSPSEFGIFDPTTLSFNSINTATSPNFDPPIEVNGLAYNILDNYLYGVVINTLGESSFQPREIVRISADGTLEGLGRATLVSDPSTELNTPAWFSGTMDGRGNYYNMVDGNTLRVVAIGDTPTDGSLTYQTFAITGLPNDPDDLNFNPVDGQLYGITQGNLYRIPPTGGAATVVTTTGDPVPFNSGGSWATSSGISYFYRNVAGGDNALFAVDLTRSPAVVHRVGPVFTNDKFDATSCTPPALTKNVEPEIAFPGDTVTYTYVLYNGYGSDIFIDFEDVLTDPNITFDTNSLSVASPGGGTVTTFNDTALSISSINIPNGVDNITNSVTFTVNAVVDNNAPVGNIDNQASLSFGAQTFPSDDPDSPPIDDPTTFTVVSSNADVVLVKRITAINGDRTKNPNDNTTLNGIVNDNVTNSADDMSNWPNGYLLGELDAGLVNPGDEIEYTVYFLNAGGTTAETVRICDWIQPNQSFVTGLYGGNDIELVIGSTTYNLTDDSDATTVDRGEVTTVGNLPAVPTCNLSGFSTSATDEVVVVDITGTTGNPTGLATLPNTTGQGTPTNAYGYFRFTTKVDE
ncbi:hypothetical protein DXZ20_34685 [Leptolyngbyaceae cyanobacterium CCMR0081]|uniref:DUF11 domain-containing protein n=1 Tax=Adonisia turfae CCMR0081 TaxID=2292702 RepID=A0A6M0RXR1_9CYAN|nr:hypothetical protein [Adonisia turfae CCMR0081]